MTEHKSGIAELNDINIYYEIHGKGEPLLLIEGLGYSSWMWFKQIPELSKNYKVIVFDNRGVGRSDKPDSEYSIEMMADDTAALLKSLGVKSAHVLGVSMGGFIAQELALRHPDTIRSLILVSTGSGVENSVPRNSLLLNGFLKFWGLMPSMLELSGKGSAPADTSSYGLTPEKKIRYGLSTAFTPDYFKDNPDVIDRIVKWRVANPQPDYAWKRQFTAAVGFNSSNRVHEIKAPTLVVVGEEDRIVSPDSSKLLAERIPNSEFKLVKGTGHLLFIERASRFNKIALGFLDKLSKDAKLPKATKKETIKGWKKVVAFLSGYPKHIYT